MMAAVDVPTYQESSMDQDDIAFPCKGCGEILDEGKAFELAQPAVGGILTASVATHVELFLIPMRTFYSWEMAR
jgi:hypothetical protein